MSRAGAVPIAYHRSQLRLKAGSMYYSCLRFASWYRFRHTFARRLESGTPLMDAFPYVAVAHSSPLFRRLRRVDMWLQHNKVNNLKLALQRLNGVVVKPGETFSFWRLVGRPSRNRGFLSGMVLVNGGFRAGIGGGLCQLTNLIYWMTLHTPLTITERFRHQYDVFPDANRTLPFGSGATVSYNYIDLQIRNHATVPYVLHLSLDQTHLYGEWRTPIPQTLRYRVFERNHRITQNTYGHYLRHNEIWRSVRDEDDTETEEMLTENHALMMYSPLLGEAASTTQD